MPGKFEGGLQCWTCGRGLDDCRPYMTRLAGMIPSLDAGGGTSVEVVVCVYCEDET